MIEYGRNKEISHTRRYIYSVCASFAITVQYLAFIATISQLQSTDPNEAKTAYKIEVGKFESILTVDGIAKVENTSEAFVADELTEYYENSVFLITHLSQKQQRKGICVDFGAYCNSSDDCTSFANTPTSSRNAFYTGICNMVAGKCEISGWCDIDQNNTSPNLVFQKLNWVEDFQITIEQFVRFPEYKMNISEVRALTVKDILAELRTDLDLPVLGNDQSSKNINVKVTWDCYRDVFSTETQCEGNYDFNELKPITPSTPGNYHHISRFTKTVYFEDSNHIPLRNVTKAKGIYLSLDVDSKIYQFQLINFFSNVGSFLPYWGMVNYVAFQLFKKVLKFPLEDDTPKNENSPNEEQQNEQREDAGLVTS